jgi:CHASE2 domain-containing sensor protein
MAEQIRWQDREPGEKFSMVMLGLCGALVVGFLMFVAAKSVISGKPDWFAILMSTVFSANIVFGIRGWRRRNAR